MIEWFSSYRMSFFVFYWYLLVVSLVFERLEE